MPYPYNNDLGIKPPNQAYKPPNHAQKPKSANFIKEKEPVWTKVIDAEMMAIVQKQMQEKLFGANPQTVKFPDVHPSVIPKDYGNHPASKQGKPDNSTKSDEELNAKLMKQLQLYGIDKEYYSTQAVDPYYYMKSKVAAAFPKLPGAPQILSEYKPALDAYEVGIKLKVAGLGIDAAVMGVHQMVGGEAAGNMHPQQLSMMLDDMLARLKENIMIEIQKKAGM